MCNSVLGMWIFVLLSVYCTPHGGIRLRYTICTYRQGQLITAWELLSFKAWTAAVMSGPHARRLLGWLSYAFARYGHLLLLQLSPNDVHSEVFVVVSLTLFLPICLEQFARDNGFWEPDHTKPCLSTPGEDTASSTGRCSVKIGWLWIDTASFRSVILDPFAVTS